MCKVCDKCRCTKCGSVSCESYGEKGDKSLLKCKYCNNRYSVPKGTPLKAVYQFS